jgi:Protein of unknown function (DUF3156)
MNNHSMTLNLFKRLFDQPPPGFRPGVTLAHVVAELRGTLALTTAAASGAVLRTTDGGLECAVRERVERHFLMHIVALEFELAVPAAAVPEGRIEVRDTGLLFRTGIACAVPGRQRAALQAVTDRIEADRMLQRALMSLNFRRCTLVAGEEGWTVLLEPYGASEVVSRRPSFRRYIRLGKEQADALVMALTSFQRILGEHHE